MSSYPFQIDGTSFYAVTEIDWQPDGQIEAFSMLGRPLPSGQGTFTVTLRAVPYTSMTGAGDPLETSGTSPQLFTIAKTAQKLNGGRSTFQTFDPLTNSYITVAGIIDFPSLIAQMQGGMANTDVNIKVNGAFISDGTWATYNGGDPLPPTDPPYIPGDQLPDPDPTKTYGWGVGRWGYGYFGRGEGV